MTGQQQLCGARAVFWPDEECIDVTCILPAGHPGIVHEGDGLGEWSEDDLSTWIPDHGSNES